MGSAELTQASLEDLPHLPVQLYIASREFRETCEFIVREDASRVLIGLGAPLIFARHRPAEPAAQGALEPVNLTGHPPRIQRPHQIKP